MAAVAVLRNDTLQAFLQVRQKFEILLKMFFVKRVSLLTQIDGAYLTRCVSELRKLRQIMRHYYFIRQAIIQNDYIFNKKQMCAHIDESIIVLVML